MDKVKEKPAAWRFKCGMGLWRYANSEQEADMFIRHSEARTFVKEPLYLHPSPPADAGEPVADITTEHLLATALWDCENTARLQEHPEALAGCLNRARALIHHARVLGLTISPPADAGESAKQPRPSVEGDRLAYGASVLSDIATAVHADAEDDILDVVNIRMKELADAEDRASKAEGRCRELVAALTPSEETKAAYMAEFAFMIPCADERGESYSRRVEVPWFAIKQIMAAILGRAALTAEKE